jgi:hypothetical protein
MKIIYLKMLIKISQLCLMRSLIIFIFISIFSLNSYSQGFRAEIQAGVAGSQVSGDQLAGFNKSGILLGAGVRTSLKEGMSLGFRMLLLQKGSRKPSKLDQGDPSYYLLRLNYIEIPVQLRFAFGKKLFAEAGPSLGYLFKSYEEDENGELTERDPFNRLDISLAGSIGYPLGNNWDFIFSTWQSILPVREHRGGTAYRLNRGQYNTVITVSLVHTFTSTNQK